MDKEGGRENKRGKDQGLREEGERQLRDKRERERKRMIIKTKIY